MSDTISSINTKLYLTSIASANEIGGVLDISGPGFSRDVIDTTNHSTSSQFKENIVSRWDGGEVTFDLNWDPRDSNHQHFTNEITSSPAADDPNTYVLRFPSETDASTFASITFTAHVTNFQPALPVEGVVRASITLRVTGAPTFNANDTTTP